MEFLHSTGLAESEQTHGKKKEKVCLDINRPSHGRTYPDSHYESEGSRGLVYFAGLMF
jgi:hypothetical protein